MLWSKSMEKKAWSRPRRSVKKSDIVDEIKRNMVDRAHVEDAISLNEVLKKLYILQFFV